MSEQNDRANSRAETAEAEIGRLLAALREWQRWYREEAGYRPRLQLEEMTDRLLGDGAIWEVAGD